MEYAVDDGSGSLGEAQGVQWGRRYSRVGGCSRTLIRTRTTNISTPNLHKPDSLNLRCNSRKVLYRPSNACQYTSVIPDKSNAVALRFPSIAHIVPKAQEPWYQSFRNAVDASPVFLISRQGPSSNCWYTPSSRSLARLLGVAADDLDLVGRHRVVPVIHLERDVLDHEGPDLVAEPVRIQASLFPTLFSKITEKRVMCDATPFGSRDGGIHSAVP